LCIGVSDLHQECTLSWAGLQAESSLHLSIHLAILFTVFESGGEVVDGRWECVLWEGSEENIDLYLGNYLHHIGQLQVQNQWLV
jgi:hypothetical protein